MRGQSVHSSPCKKGGFQRKTKATVNRLLPLSLSLLHHPMSTLGTAVKLAPVFYDSDSICHQLFLFRFFYAPRGKFGGGGGEEVYVGMTAAVWDDWLILDTCIIR